MHIQLWPVNIFLNGLLLRHSKSEPFHLFTSMEGYYFTAFTAAEGPLSVYFSLLFIDILTNTKIHLKLRKKKVGKCALFGKAKPPKGKRRGCQVDLCLKLWFFFFQLTAPYSFTPLLTLSLLRITTVGTVYITGEQHRFLWKTLTYGNRWKAAVPVDSTGSASARWTD